MVVGSWVGMGVGVGMVGLGGPINGTPVLFPVKGPYQLEAYLGRPHPLVARRCGGVGGGYG